MQKQCSNSVGRNCIVVKFRVVGPPENPLKLVNMEKSPQNSSELNKKLWFLENPPQISVDLLLVCQKGFLKSHLVV